MSYMKMSAEKNDSFFPRFLRNRTWCVKCCTASPRFSPSQPGPDICQLCAPCCIHALSTGLSFAFRKSVEAAPHFTEDELRPSAAWEMEAVPTPVTSALLHRVPQLLNRFLHNAGEMAARPRCQVPANSPRPAPGHGAGLPGQGTLPHQHHLF